MTSWTESPLAAFDLETTGPDPLTARIVTACLTVIDGKETRTQTWLLDPEIEIPDGAAKVHGITTDRARAEGAPYADGYEEIRTAVKRAWLEGRVIAAYNASFDFTIVDREGARLGHPALDFGSIVDPFVIDREVDKYRKGKRTLDVTCKHYGIRLDNAHTADADALAAARLAWVLGHNPGLMKLTSAELMAQQAEWHQARQVDYAKYLRRTAGQEPDEEKAAELLARAATVVGDWPIRGAA